MLYATNSNVIANVKINDMKVSGLSQIELQEKLENIIDNMLGDEIILAHNEIEKSFTLKQLELETDIPEISYKACTIGRDSNVFANNYRILKVLANGENLTLNIKFNDEILKSVFSNLSDEWAENFVDNSYYVDGDKLIIVRGKTGVVIDEDLLKSEIINLVNRKIAGENVNKVEIPTITKNPTEINLEQIQKEVYKEPKDASYNKSTSELVTHANGIDFGISIDDAKKLISEEKEEYTIPLKITKPDVTTDMLGEDAFPNILASFSTRYDASNINRATNIELASEAINGTVLLPGEKFSFNGIVGPTTASKGYLLAGAYAARRTCAKLWWRYLPSIKYYI